MLLVVMLGIISLLATGLFRCYALKKGLMDIPNQRSSHQVKTPRGGGVVFVSLWSLGCIIGCWLQNLPWALLVLLLVPSLSIALVGFIDDHHSLSAKVRLLIHLIASAFFIAGLHVLYRPFQILALPHSLSLVLSFLALVWSTNLFNFMDGTDGFSATEGIVVLGVGAFLLHQSGASSLTMISLNLCATLLGFLYWNWPSARIFMGDVGSGFLGFLIAAMALIGAIRHELSLGYWFILFGIFWFDATITLLRRYVSGHKISEAHRLHAYQRLHQAGFSHAKLLWGAIACNMALGAIALVVFYHPGWMWYGVGAAIFLLSMIYYEVERRFPFKK